MVRRIYVPAPLWKYFVLPVLLGFLPPFLLLRCCYEAWKDQVWLSGQHRPAPSPGSWLAWQSLLYPTPRWGRCLFSPPKKKETSVVCLSVPTATGMLEMLAPSRGAVQAAGKGEESFLNLQQRAHRHPVITWVGLESLGWVGLFEDHRIVEVGEDL